jgi:hypothetical protein
MTPQEKAKELIDMFGFIYSYDGLDIMDDNLTNEDRKRCAFIAVDLLMEEAYRQHDYEGFISYWKEVKHEIEKL